MTSDLHAAPALPRHRLTFPPASSRAYSQSEATFDVWDGDEPTRLRFHDYDEIYARPGLYEQVFYERLRCVSPEKVAGILDASLRANGGDVARLRVLDLGAGNGIMGARLKQMGASRVVGADIIPAARDAAYRDRPGAYDDYVVADMASLDEGQRRDLGAWRFDALTCVAALGFGDIPVAAFQAAMDLVAKDGWLAFNIKETFLAEGDDAGFSRFVRELIGSDAIEVHHLERYRHRLSMEGEPLYYYALVARKAGR